MFGAGFTMVSFTADIFGGNSNSFKSPPVTGA